MCSSLLGLGETYVQQCFVCLSPQYLCAAFSCLFKSNSICLYSLTCLNNTTWASSPQIQSLPNTFCVPDDVVTCLSFFHIISSIYPVFRLFSTVYDRTTVRTSDVSYVPYEIFQNFKFHMTCVLYVHVHARFLCPIYSTTFDVSYVPYEIIWSNNQSNKAHQQKQHNF